MNDPVKEKIYYVPAYDDRNRKIGWELYLNGYLVDSGPFLEPLKSKFAAASPVEFVEASDKVQMENMVSRDKLR